METAVFRQTKSIRLDNTDWSALAELAKASNRSLNNYLETLVKNAISVARDVPKSQSIDEFEQEVLQSLAEVESGKVAFRGTLAELRQRYEGV